MARTFTVTVERRYGSYRDEAGNSQQYVTWDNITLDATSAENAGRLACMRYPKSWTVKAIRAQRHEYCAF